MNIQTTGEFKQSLHLTEEFRAPRDKIFRVWTEPENLKKWFMAEEGWKVVKAEVDLYPRGSYYLGVLAPEAETEMYIKGVFQKIEPREYLEYTWTVAVMNGRDTLVSVKFLDHEGGTRIELTHGIFESPEEARLHIEGWKGCVNRLQKELTAILK